MKYGFISTKGGMGRKGRARREAVGLVSKQNNPHLTATGFTSGFLSPFLRLPLWTQEVAGVSQMKASFRLHLLSTGKPSSAEGLTSRTFHLLLQPPVQKLSQNGCSIEQRRALRSSPLLDVTTLRSVQRQNDYTEPGQDVFKFHSM